MLDVVRGIGCTVDVMTDDFEGSCGELVDVIHDVSGTDCEVDVMVQDVTASGFKKNPMVDFVTGSIFKIFIEFCITYFFRVLLLFCQS